MRDPSIALVWALCLATTVYGHIALKLAMSGRSERAVDLLRGLFTPWAVSGVLAWCVSSLLWLRVLSRQTLFAASSVSALKYVLLALASTVVLREAVSARQWAGFAFIAVGVWLAAK